jgi:tRNA-Thr(GGU) m(6)t(6)A37 methyltransferase TsaA
MILENNLLLKCKLIGIIHSSLKEAKGSPIQPVFARDSEGIVEVYEPYREALKDLDGFERIWLIYWFHKADKFRPVVKPYLDTVEHGLFATRAPCRPKPIGMSPVRLLRIENGMLYIAEVDILDGTPLLDIKPYISKFDQFEVSRNGWQDNVSGEPPKADKRFHKENEKED